MLISIPALMATNQGNYESTNRIHSLLWQDDHLESTFITVSDSSKLSHWMGKWEGTLMIYSATKPIKEVPMKIWNFETDTIGTYGWYLIYGEDEEKGTRPYFLKTISTETGHYQVDEKNGIILDSYLIGDKMISTFDVQGSLISSIYTLETDGRMTFEILFGKSDDPNITGGKDDIPSVESYKMGGYQKAVLQRVDEEDK